MKRLFNLVVVLPLGACSSTPSTAPTQETARSVQQVCTREAPTGRRIPVTICRNLDDVEHRRAADRETAEKIPVGLHDVLLGR